MHTRYSPIRHSHGAEAPIPSDLHVLSLPLAFILSQDQTLHCRNCRPAPARRPVVSFAPATLLSTFCSSFFSLHCLKDPPLRPPPPSPPSRSKARAKIGRSPVPAKCYPQLFFSPAPRRSAKAPMNLRGSRRGRPENFFRARPPRARKTPLFTPPRRGPAGATRAHTRQTNTANAKRFFTPHKPPTTK